MVSSAVFAPLRSMMALVASVVPCTIRFTSPGATPASAVTERRAATTACSGARGVVSVFAVKRRSPTSNATSVNVPPMSRPMRMLGGVTLKVPNSDHAMICRPKILGLTWRSLGLRNEAPLGGGHC